MTPEEHVVAEAESMVRKESLLARREALADRIRASLDRLGREDGPQDAEKPAPPE